MFLSKLLNPTVLMSWLLLSCFLPFNIVLFLFFCKENRHANECKHVCTLTLYLNLLWRQILVDIWHIDKTEIRFIGSQSESGSVRVGVDGGGVWAQLLTLVKNCGAWDSLGSAWRPELPCWRALLVLREKFPTSTRGVRHEMQKTLLWARVLAGSAFTGASSRPVSWSAALQRD